MQIPALSLRLTPVWPLLAVLAGGCADGTDPLEPGPGGRPTTVATVTVSPPQATLFMGETRLFTALAHDGRGHPVSGRGVQWSAQPTTVATVSDQGVVTAVSQGDATITATIDGKQGSAVILVVPPTVEGVDLDATQLRLDEGDTHRLTATPRDSEGRPIPSLGMTWSTSEPDIVMVAPDGAVTSLRPGSALVTVRVHGKTASAAITVEGSHPADLVFARQEIGLEPELLVVDPRDSTRTARPLAAGGVRGRAPAPSPDGSSIAYVVVDAWGSTDLRIVDRATGAITVLTNGPEADDQPKWSPDGSRIAFTRRIGGGPAHIWVIGAAGATARNLTADLPGTFASPAWSPASIGGDRIAFSRSLAGLGAIWTMAADGTDHRQVTDGANYYDDEPAWSPDGQTIAFSRAGGPSRDIWLVNAAGGNERGFVALPMHQSTPSWSPDGRLLSFISGFSTSSDIYTVWASGPARLARRTADQLAKNGLAWVGRP